MLASKPASFVRELRIEEPRDRGWGAAVVAAAVFVGALTSLYFGNPRMWGSWHGFLHAAIATRFSEGVFPPENPFFAGQPLPYYWAYHFVGYWLSQILRLDLLHTFHAISWISLAALVFVAIH